LGEREVDFVAEKDGNREYYQVAYRLMDPKTVEREFSVLQAVPDSFPKTVLTLDRIPMRRNGIHHYYLPCNTAPRLISGQLAIPHPG
jgi:hypothetical protein